MTTSVVDSKDRPVPTAHNLITFEVSGAGHLLGVGNGDPSSHESHKGPDRRLFNGLAMALVQSQLRAGRIVLTARSPGLRSARLTLQARAAALAALLV